MRGGNGEKIVGGRKRGGVAFVARRREREARARLFGERRKKEIVDVGALILRGKKKRSGFRSRFLEGETDVPAKKKKRRPVIDNPEEKEKKKCGCDAQWKGKKNPAPSSTTA